jgi:ABC-type transport system involved in cytochrome c biogenesis permease subunit
MTTRLLLAAWVVVAAGALAACSKEEPAGAVPRWSPEVLDLATEIPIQNEGRVKPLGTYAGYTLLGIHHKRTVKDAWDRPLPPMEWLLDALFRPEVATKVPVFTVEDSDVLDAIGLSHEGKKKRDRYTYEQIAPGIPRLAELAETYRGIDAKTRDRVQGGVVDLYGNVVTFDRLLGAFDAVRVPLALGASEPLRALFPGKEAVTLWEAAPRWREIEALAGTQAPTGDGNGHGDGHGSAPASHDAAASDLVARARPLLARARLLAVVPPSPNDRDPEWGTLYDLLLVRAVGRELPPDHDALAEALAALPGAASSNEAFLPAIREVRDLTVRMASARGEYEKVPLEVALAAFDPFYLSLWFYIGAFVLFAFSWLELPGGLRRGFAVAGWASLFAAVGIHVAGIVMRCVLRERPPIKTLYETVIFISAAGAIALMVTEWLTKRRIAAALAPILGGLLLFVGNRFETLEGRDTMPQLVAVLDTNFWLALHVTAITLGYTGGLLAALVGHVHVLGRAFGIGRDSPDAYRMISKMTYGILCFGLIFSVSGTILGGIWANDSWGRFWGWDPKENGALLICLAQVAIIHSRLGGLLKPFGIAMAAIAQGVVVVFSWWHVNQLGVGLHSYGFTAGVVNTLYKFYAIEGLVLTAGIWAWASGRAYPAPPAATSTT